MTSVALVDTSNRKQGVGTAFPLVYTPIAKPPFPFIAYAALPKTFARTCVAHVAEHPSLESVNGVVTSHLPRALGSRLYCIDRRLQVFVGL